jgi:PelA/Pel-15E family pectate lyase
MKPLKIFTPVLLLSIAFCKPVTGQDTKLLQGAKDAMLRSTRFMVEKASTNGGYVWYYLPDFSRRWGEMEAYKTMIWMQNPGTVSMGHLFLDAYQATGDDYYYQAAAKAASAIVWGQNPEGGWNYMIDFAGDRSLKMWYNTIGKNGWRLEEFQHYYGNSTYDDDVSSNAAMFLLRIYLEKMDPVWKPSLDKAISFILESQYPLGGWPQRYPLKFDFNKEGHPDYTSYYTFNDGVIWENVNFLIQCYLMLGQERLLDPIRRGMYFYMISQDSSGGWAQQLNMALEPEGARTYEPKALLPRNTIANAMLLIKFYQYTGDSKFLARVPEAIKWLEKTALPVEQSQGGRYTHSTFVEPGTNKPLYVHRQGSNSKYGRYYVDYNDQKLLSHYGGKSFIPVNQLKNEYNRVLSLSREEATKDSPLKSEIFQKDGTPQKYYNLDQEAFPFVPGEKQVNEIINSLDIEGRWLVKHVSISNPYIGDGQKQDMTDEFSSKNVGDETDTSPFQDQSDQQYISTPVYIRNMHTLISYIQSVKVKVNSAESSIKK